MPRRLILACAGSVLACLAGPALAQDVPFYGFSPYFGGPTTYYTDDTDVQQATTIRDGEPGFGIRTYTRGGPFWGYRPARVRPAYASRRYERTYRRRVLRVRG